MIDNQINRTDAWGLFLSLAWVKDKGSQVPSVVITRLEHEYCNLVCEGCSDNVNIGLPEYLDEILWPIELYRSLD